MQKRIVCRDILAEICWRRKLKIYFSLLAYTQPPFIHRVTTCCFFPNISPSNRLSRPMNFYTIVRESSFYKRNPKKKSKSDFVPFGRRV